MDRLTNAAGLKVTDCTNKAIEDAIKKLAAYEDTEESGLLVRMPGMLIAPYVLNERFWICGWDDENCTMTIQDRKLQRDKIHGEMVAAMDWNEAENYLNRVIADQASYGTWGYIRVALLPLKNRYDAGERTRELYDAIMECE